MTTTVTAKIQVRKGTAAQWTSANPTLLSGEIGFETDTIKLKIGDGTTAWTALAYHHDPDLAATYAAIAHTHSGVYEPANANLQSHLSSTANPHSVTAAQVGADATGTAAGLIATHESAVNPHPGYLTPTEGDAAYAALSHDHSGVYEASGAVSTHAAVTSSVHGITTFGASLVDDADAGTARNTLGLGTAATTAATDYATAAHNHTGTYDPAGTASSAVSSHEGAADPHPGYALESSLGGAALLSVGTTAGTVAAGDDARFSTGTTGDAFASSHPGGNQHIDWTADQGATNLHAGNIPDLSGTYAVTAKGVTNGDSHDHSGGDGAQIAYSGLSGLPTLGTAAATAATDYATAAQGATADTAVQPGDDAADLGSGSATDGYVLTADGVGGSAWEAAAVTYAGAASEIHAATEKTTPVDADELGLVDSAASWVLKRLTWANVKATLAGVFPLLAGKSGGQTLIGGTGVTDKLVLQGTSGNGTSTATALEVKVGNNGATNALTVLNDGNVGINKSNPSVPFHIVSGTGELKFQNVSQNNLYVSGVNASIVLDSINTSYPGLFLRNKGIGISQWAVSDDDTVFVSKNKIIFSPNNNSLSASNLGCFAHNGFGYGTTSPAAWIHSLKTTEQLRLGYDATHYVSHTVDSSGNCLIDAVGGTIYTPDVIENTTSGSGIVLRSPNGTRYMITVTDAGTLSVSAA